MAVILLGFHNYQVETIFPRALGEACSALTGVMTLEAWVQTPIHSHFNPASKETLDLLEVSCKRCSEQANMNF